MADIYFNFESASPNPSNGHKLPFLKHTARSSSKECAAPCAMERQRMRTLIRSRFTSWARQEHHNPQRAFVPTVGSSASPATHAQIHLQNQLQMKLIWRCWFSCRARMALKLRRWRNPYLKPSSSRQKTSTAETQRNAE